MTGPTNLSEHHTKTGVSALLIGPSGHGKTYALGQSEGKSIILDIEDGSRTLKNVPFDTSNIDLWTVNKDMTNINEVGNFNYKDYQNIYFDNVCELYDSMCRLEGKNNKDDSDLPGLRDYHKCQYQLQRFIACILQWTQKGKNIIFTGWDQHLEYENKADGTLNTVQCVSLGNSKLCNKIHGQFDIVGLLMKKGDKRVICLDGNDRQQLKDRVYKRKFCPATAKALLGGEEITTKKKE